MKILITGAGGQLGREFVRCPTKEDDQIIGLSERELDITDKKAVFDTISFYKPAIIINCAAYNLVDKAEEEFEIALATNAVGVRNLAAGSKKESSLLIHYSSDYIFDGRKEDFYLEDDTPNPINNYGRSKLAGERELVEETDNFLLFRTSWVFGEGIQNFLYKLAEWAKRDRRLKVVSDQISIPTYTEDIVKVTMLAIENGLRGVYHLTNSGYASRYEVARYFIERLGMDNLILPVSSDHFQTKATRPYFSVLSNRKVSTSLKINIPEWKDGIDKFVRRYYV